MNILCYTFRNYEQMQGYITKRSLHQLHSCRMINVINSFSKLRRQYFSKANSKYKVDWEKERERERERELYRNEEVVSFLSSSVFNQLCKTFALLVVCFTLCLWPVPLCLMLSQLFIKTFELTTTWRICFALLRIIYSYTLMYKYYKYALNRWIINKMYILLNL